MRDLGIFSSLGGVRHAPTASDPIAIDDPLQAILESRKRLSQALFTGAIQILDLRVLIDRIEVRWIGGGVDVLKNIKADQFLTITQRSGGHRD